MATKRLIDPERYKTTLQRFEEHLTESGKLEAAEAVKSLIKGLKIAPTVDAVPVVHGRWLYDSGSGNHFCSVCDEYAIEQLHMGSDGVEYYEGYLTDFCPNCGADMR